MKVPTAIQGQRCVWEKECTRSELVPVNNTQIFPVIDAGFEGGQSDRLPVVTHAGRVTENQFLPRESHRTVQRDEKKIILEAGIATPLVPARLQQIFLRHGTSTSVVRWSAPRFTMRDLPMRI